MDRWFSAAACLLALIAAGFAFSAGSVEFPAIRNSQDHFIEDLALAAEARHTQATRNMIAASAGILAACGNIVVLAMRFRKGG